MKRAFLVLAVCGVMAVGTSNPAEAQQPLHGGFYGGYGSDYRLYNSYDYDLRHDPYNDYYRDNRSRHHDRSRYIDRVRYEDRMYRGGRYDSAHRYDYGRDYRTDYLDHHRYNSVDFGRYGNWGTDCGLSNSLSPGYLDYNYNSYNSGWNGYSRSPYGY